MIEKKMMIKTAEEFNTKISKVQNLISKIKKNKNYFKDLREKEDAWIKKSLYVKYAVQNEMAEQCYIFNVKQI